MIANIAFTGEQHLDDRRVVRRLVLVPPTLLRLEEVCRLANAVNDRLAALFGCAVSIEVIEPVPLDGSMHRRLFDEAHILRVRGEAVDAFVVVRRRDARRLVDFAFAQAPIEEAAPLSMLEQRLVHRVLCNIATACTTLCGRLRGLEPDTPHSIARDATVYFEVRLLGPTRAIVGIALRGEPASNETNSLQIDDLRGVRLQARAVIGRGTLTLSRLASLGPGSLVPLSSTLEDLGTLEVGGSVFARGYCGVDRNRVAFQVTEPIGSTAANERG